MSSSAVNQLKDLISEGKVVLVNESGLNSKVRAIYDAAYSDLAGAMNSTRPNKNRAKCVYLHMQKQPEYLYLLQMKRICSKS